MSFCFGSHFWSVDLSFALNFVPLSLWRMDVHINCKRNREY